MDLNSSSGSDAAHDVEAEIYRKMGKRKTNYLKIQRKSRPHFISNSMVYWVDEEKWDKKWIRNKMKRVAAFIWFLYYLNYKLFRQTPQDIDA